jgi:hypothetical protein
MPQERPESTQQVVAGILQHAELNIIAKQDWQQQRHILNVESVMLPILEPDQSFIQ